MIRPAFMISMIVAVGRTVGRSSTSTRLNRDAPSTIAASCSAGSTADRADR